MPAATTLAIDLRQKKSLLHRLLTLAKEQRTCLISGNALRLGEIVGEQTLVMQRLSRLFGSVISEQLDPDQAQEQLTQSEEYEIADLKEEIISLAEQLQRAAKINNRLAKESMHYIDFSMSLLGGRHESPAYSQKGKNKKASSAYLMNRTA